MAGLFYIGLKKYTSAALRFYFSRWQVSGLHHIPAGPVIFVPNHQNAFLDAVLVACSTAKNPWFLTRANVFKKPLAAKILGLMQMLPIYRFRDGYVTLRKNEEVINSVVAMLNRGESVLIFAEGNHGDKWQLRPLQKGVTRIAFSVDEKVNAAIVPTGIQYENKNGYRSRVLISFGEPLYINQMDFSGINPQDRSDAVLFEIKKRLVRLILHIENPGYDEKVHYLQKHRRCHSDLVDQLQSDQQIVQSYPSALSPASVPLKKSAWKSLFRYYALLNSAIPRWITNNIILANIADPQFTGSVRFASGMTIIPVFWVIQAIVIGMLTNSLVLACVYLVSLPLAVKGS